MIAGRPVKICSLCAVADNCSKSELIFLGIKCLKCSLHGIRTCDRCRIDACLLKNVCVVSETDCFCCVREADNFAFTVNIFSFCVFYPLLTAHISKKAFPVSEIRSTAVYEDIRHIVALIVLLQLALNVYAAAHGFDFNMNA